MTTPYPTLSRAERIADFTVHGLGIGGAIVAVTIFFAMNGAMFGGVTLAALVIYACALILMLTASGAYHFAAYTPLRPYLRRLDHAAIYIKIAGTLTPMAVLIGSAFGYALLALVWATALGGAALKVLAKRGKLPTGPLPYVLLGWIGAALVVPLTQIVPGAAVALIVAGGLTYTAGVIFYRWDGLRFNTAIWHAFVLVASGFFFAAIATAAIAAA